MKDNEYGKFIEQKRFENELENMFKEGNVDNKEVISENKKEKPKKKIIKEEKTEIPHVKYPEPKDKFENPPKDFNVDDINI